ncbi:MAG: hypothetical protein F6K47_08930 [Symploca sp. SIO2E6]|nr:hypothetical protein [Symploca sp. SIO2E6]
MVCCIGVKAMPDKTFNHFMFFLVQENGMDGLKNLTHYSLLTYSPTPYYILK